MPQKHAGFCIYKTMAGRIDLIGAAVNHANEISESNKEHINALFGEVAKFKIE